MPYDRAQNQYETPFRTVFACLIASNHLKTEAASPVGLSFAAALAGCHPIMPGHALNWLQAAALGNLLAERLYAVYQGWVHLRS